MLRAFDRDEIRSAVSGAADVDVVAVGKAAGPMLAAASDLLTRSVRTLIGIGPQQATVVPPATEWIVAGHPVPTEASVDAARRALEVAANQGAGDLLVVLLSGGASALMAMPVDGVTLQDKQQAVRTLLKEGATINELNCVRKHLSAIKGGRLAVATKGTVVTLAISDVVGEIGRAHV